ncbi:hypothetical protein, partial [Anaerotignum lactatifermentans]|uniref:hypothetical protein n=1 Tax=Anaerotignum lactatifermentans TaxID=160404 RepID=UPI0019612851
SRENATKLALLAEVMKEGTKALPSNLHLNRRAEELYVKIYDKKTKDTSKVSFVFFFARIFFAALGKNRSKRK